VQLLFDGKFLRLPDYGQLLKPKHVAHYTKSIFQLQFQRTFFLILSICFPITVLTDVFSNPVIYFPIIVLTEAFSNPVINFADHNSLSLPQITNSLVSYVLSLQVQTSLLIDCVQSHSSWFLSVSTDTFRNSKSNKFTAEPFWSFPFTIH